MGISVLKSLLKHSLLAVTVLLMIIAEPALSAVNTYAADTAGIDDDTVITVEQAGSIATSIGSYGWDSRAAVVDYCSLRGDISGSLGTVMFTDENGVRRAFLWDEWGGAFPDSFGRMLAEKLRASVPESEIPAVRAALSDSMIFNCTWQIAIGIKSSQAGGKLYKTLRTDNTLRVAYGKNLDNEAVAERLFTGDEMAKSLQFILPHETWGSSSLATFAERNPYCYMVQINSYDIEVRATNCTVCAAKGISSGSQACTHITPGTYFNDRIPIVYDGKSYSGDRSFAWEGQTVEVEKAAYKGYVRNPAKDDLSGLVGTMTDDRITPTGDSVVYLCYESDGTGNPASPGPGQTGEVESLNQDEPVVSTHESDSQYSVTDPLAAAAIRSEVFDVSSAIPSTEPVYVYATARDYLYTLDATVVSGEWTFGVNVSLPYELNWEEKGKKQTESGVLTKTVTVSRPYSFVHINSFAYYTLENITVGNRAMSPSRIVLTPSVWGRTMPSCSQPTSYGGAAASLGANVMLPVGFYSSVTAEKITVTSKAGKPDVPDFTVQDASKLAEAAVGSMQCRNDELVFNGVNVLGTTGWHNYSGTESMNTYVLKPTLLTFDTRALYGKNYMSVPATVRNSVYVTDARILKYTPVVRYGGAAIGYNPLLNVNNVSVHTPVVCSLVIGESSSGTYTGNRDYNQEVKAPESGVFQLVAGASDSYGIAGHENDSCDFTLHISNSGQHGVYQGRLGSNYDYYYNVAGLNGSKYVEVNEVRFPFDVYMDVGSNRKTSDDRMIEAGEWLSVGTGTYRFYIPEYVAEGDYVIEARSRTVNSYSREDMTGGQYKNGKIYLHDNSSTYDYVAADSVKVHVSGKMSGLRLTGISSKAEWGDVLLMSKNASVKDGTLVSVLPDGKVKNSDLKSYFFYYTAGSSNELGLSTGRHARFTLPLLNGSHPDLSGMNVGMLKSGYVWNFELDTTGTTMASNKAYIVMTPVFEWISADRTTREPAELYYRSGYKDTGREPVTLTSANRQFTGGTNSIYRQTWTFTYSLPATPVIKVGGEVKTEGYLVVNFDITAYDASGRPYLSYGKGRCSMWKTEGQQTVRKDYYGNTYNLKYGDVIVVNLEADKSSDYVTDQRY